MIFKNDILNLAKEVEFKGKYSNDVTRGSVTKTYTTDLMNFTLSRPSATTQIATSSDLVSNTSGIHAALSWSPNPLAPNTQSTLHISFYDPTGIAPLTNTNVKYNLIIYDKNNHPVITKQNLLATNAAGTETIVFPAAQIYHMQVQITD